MPKNSKAGSLQKPVLKVLKIHFGFVLAVALSLVAFDTWNLITHEGIMQRWTLLGVVFIVNIVVWYMARADVRSQLFYKLLVLGLAITDIVFASINVFWERGMSSRYVAVYLVPIALAAVLRSRKAMMATAALSMAAYIMTTTRYFYEHYGEGFKVELYGVAFFFSAIFFVVAFLVDASFPPND